MAAKMSRPKAVNKTRPNGAERSEAGERRLSERSEASERRLQMVQRDWPKR